MISINLFKHIKQLLNQNKKQNQSNSLKEHRKRVYNKLIIKKYTFQNYNLPLQNKKSRANKMKYHEKVSLKSPIYKYSNNNTSRTPIKSPIKPSVNPVQLFQKVCCPNCKYAFKIIKQQILKQNPLEITTPITRKSRIKQKKSTQVQTENQPVITVHQSPTKSSKSPMRLSRSPGLRSTQNLQNHKMSKLSEILHSQNTQNRRLREAQFKFTPLSLSPNDKITKSKNLLKTLDPKILASDSFKVQQSYTSRKGFELSTPTQGKFALSLNDSMQDRQKSELNYLQSPRKSSQKFASNQRRNTPRQNLLCQNEEDIVNRNRSRTGVDSVKNQQMNFSRKSNHQLGKQTQIIEKNCCRCKDNPQLNTFILETLVKNTQNKQIILELQQFCKFASEQVEVPSYCKMLALIQQ